MPQESMTFQQQFPQLFQQGLANQQNKKWDDAISKYKNILDQGLNGLTNEQASVIYHNMAASAFEKADYLNSYVWSKKAITLNPNNSFAKNLFSEAGKKFQPTQIPHQISTVESIQKVGLKYVSFDILLIGVLAFFSISLFLSLKIWLSRKKDRLESESLSTQKKQPIGAVISLIALLLVTASFLFLSVIKWSDLTVPKAIIISDKASVQTATGGDQASIYEASAGLEVDILKMDANFVQIRYPGAFSGWVNKKNLEILTYPTWPQ